MTLRKLSSVILLASAIVWIAIAIRDYRAGVFLGWVIADVVVAITSVLWAFDFRKPSLDGIGGA